MGAIEALKPADLVIRDGDLLTVTEDKIMGIKAVETFKEGKSVCKRKGA